MCHFNIKLIEIFKINILSKLYKSKRNIRSVHKTKQNYRLLSSNTFATKLYNLYLKSLFSLKLIQILEYPAVFASRWRVVRISAQEMRSFLYRCRFSFNLPRAPHDRAFLSASNEEANSCGGRFEQHMADILNPHIRTLCRSLAQ